MGASNLLSKLNKSMCLEVELFTYLARLSGSCWCCTIAVRHLRLVSLKLPKISYITSKRKFVLLVHPVRFVLVVCMSITSISC